MLVLPEEKSSCSTLSTWAFAVTSVGNLRGERLHCDKGVSTKNTLAMQQSQNPTTSATCSIQTVPRCGCCCTESLPIIEIHQRMRSDDKYISIFPFYKIISIYIISYNNLCNIMTT